MMYYSHNLHFIAMCSAMNGDYPEAMKSAQMLAAHVRPHVKDMPPLEGFMTIPIAVNVRFHKWDDILKMPKPDPEMKTDDRVLAFRPRHGAGRQRQAGRSPGRLQGGSRRGEEHAGRRGLRHAGK